MRGMRLPLLSSKKTSTPLLSLKAMVLASAALAPPTMLLEEGILTLLKKLPSGLVPSFLVPIRLPCTLLLPV